MKVMELDAKGVIETCPHCGQKNRIQFDKFDHAARCGRCKAELPRVDSPIEIEEDQMFESLIGSANVPVLVDFWAEWCGPCKMMAPEVAKVAAKNASSLAVAKVNTEGLPTLAQRYQISALPTLVLFVGGMEIARTEGARPAVQIQRFVDQTVRTA